MARAASAVDRASEGPVGVVQRRTAGGAGGPEVLVWGFVVVVSVSISLPIEMILEPPIVVPEMVGESGEKFW